MTDRNPMGPIGRFFYEPYVIALVAIEMFLDRNRRRINRWLNSREAAKRQPAAYRWFCSCGWSGSYAELADDYYGDLDVPGGAVSTSTACPSCGTWLTCADDRREVRP